MHHLVIDLLEPRVKSLYTNVIPELKLAALLVFLIALSTTPPAAQAAFAAYAILLVSAAYIARLPIRGLAGRAALVLPFSVSLRAAHLVVLGRFPLRALALAGKSFLSGAWLRCCWWELRRSPDGPPRSAGTPPAC